MAANKIDRIPGWKPQPTFSFLESYKQQDPYVKQALDDYLYRIIGRFSELSFRADRFDRVRDFTRTVAIVPTSAKTGEGITELVAVLTGLTQQFLRRRLQVTSGPAKGTILEVKEEVGLGTTVNAIIYDGILRRDDIIVLGGRNGPIVTTVRALLLPKPLDEIRDPRDKFSSVNEVSAAVGVKIAAPNLEDALAGAPLYVAESNEKIDDLLREVSEEVERLRILTDVDGVILKTDALGSLEAIAENLKRNDIPIRFADVGDVSKRDVIEASVVKENKPLYGVILAFNVRVLPDAEEEAKIRGIPLFCNNIIYHLIDDYLRWLEKKKAEIERGEFERLVKPAKIKILPGYIFRRAKPAIVGVEVLAGTIKPRLHLIREDGKEIGEILQIQDRGKAIPKADKGSQVAISIDKPVVGRHIDEGDILYVNVPEAHARQLFSKFMERLSSDEIECLNEIAEIMSTKKPFWGR